MKSKRMRTILLTLGLLSSLTLGTTAAAVPAQTVSSDDSKSIFIVKKNAETLEDALVRQSATNPEYKKQAIEFLKGRLQQDPQKTRSAVDTLNSGSKKTAETLKSLQNLDTAQAENKVAALAAPDPGNIGTWPVRGSAQGDKSYWIAKPAMVIEGVYCGILQPCKVTDRYTANLTITPSVYSSMYNIRTLYSPNSGRLSGVRVNFVAVNNGVPVGKTINVDLPPGTDNNPRYGYINSDRSMSGKALTIAFEMHMQSPSGPIYDAAKTGDCIGRSGDDTRCFYY